MNKIKESQIDVIKSIILSLIVFTFTVILWIAFLEPLEQLQLDQVTKNCLSPECTYTIDPSWVNVVILISPALLCYVLAITHFESNRENKWQNLH